MNREQILNYLYRIMPRIASKRVPYFLNYYLENWNAIDRRKDKSLSAKDFRLYVYLSECERLRSRSWIGKLIQKLERWSYNFFK